MDPSLISNFIRFLTAKLVWDSIATTYFDGTDTSQNYDLKRRVTKMRQVGGSIEKYYNDLQGLWKEIDFRRPNPMNCATDIQNIIQSYKKTEFISFLMDWTIGRTRFEVMCYRYVLSLP